MQNKKKTVILTYINLIVEGNMLKMNNQWKRPIFLVKDRYFWLKTNFFG